MSKPYQPELGQALFGQPWKPHECPPHLEAVLVMIREDLGRVLGNINQREIDPFGNTGEDFDGKAFAVHAYSWDDEHEQPWNFKCGNIEVSWYKHLRRGLSCNREVSPGESAAMLRVCLAEIHDMEDKHLRGLGIR